MTENKHINDSSISGEKHKGLVQVLTGDGKGKTTAAVGSIVRALSHGLSVYVAVFMKNNNPFGEWTYLSRTSNVRIENFGSENFCRPSDVKPEEKERANLALQAARNAMCGGKYDLVVLDEVNVAAAWKLIDTNDVIKLIEDRPSHVRLIFTGRYADREIIKRADLVTEMLNIKHPFDAGEPAREGIEY